jgi:hypothetical protein
MSRVIKEKARVSQEKLKATVFSRPRRNPDDLEIPNSKFSRCPAMLPYQRNKGAGAMIFLLVPGGSFNNAN